MENRKKKPSDKETRGQKIFHPHDKGYKRDLSNPKEFLHFLQKYVGAEWTEHLSASQLHLCDKEFIERDYGGR